MLVIGIIWKGLSLSARKHILKYGLIIQLLILSLLKAFFVKKQMSQFILEIHHIWQMSFFNRESNYIHFKTKEFIYNFFQEEALKTKVLKPLNKIFNPLVSDVKIMHYKFLAKVSAIKILNLNVLIYSHTIFFFLEFKINCHFC